MGPFESINVHIEDFGTMWPHENVLILSDGTECSILDGVV